MLVDSPHHIGRLPAADCHALCFRHPDMSSEGAERMPQTMTSDFGKVVLPADSIDLGPEVILRLGIEFTFSFCLWHGLQQNFQSWNHDADVSLTLNGLVFFFVNQSIIYVVLKERLSLKAVSSFNIK